MEKILVQNFIKQ